MGLRQSQPVSRRCCVAALAAVSLAGIAWPAAADEPPALSFVRDLYRREVDRHNNRTKMPNEAFTALFSSDMRALMQAPRSGLSDEPIGRILHAFFGWGVRPGQPVTFVQADSARGGSVERPAVRVVLDVHGARRDVLIRVLRENGLWKISDIDYGDGESLREYYRRITRR